MPTPLEVIAAAMDDDLMMYQADYQNAQAVLAALQAAGYKIVPASCPSPVSVHSDILED